MFADDIALVNFEDNWGKLKQTVEVHLRCIYDTQYANQSYSNNFEQKLCMES